MPVAACDTMELEEHPVWDPAGRRTLQAAMTPGGGGGGGGGWQADCRTCDALAQTGGGKCAGCWQGSGQAWQASAAGAMKARQMQQAGASTSMAQETSPVQVRMIRDGGGMDLPLAVVAKQGDAKATATANKRCEPDADGLTDAPDDEVQREQKRLCAGLFRDPLSAAVVIDADSDEPMGMLPVSEELGGRDSLESSCSAEMDEDCAELLNSGFVTPRDQMLGSLLGAFGHGGSHLIETQEQVQESRRRARITALGAAGAPQPPGTTALAKASSDSTRRVLAMASTRGGSFAASQVVNCDREESPWSIATRIRPDPFD